MKKHLVVCSLFLAATAAYGGIVLDSNPPVEVAATPASKPGIEVPKPKDTTPPAAADTAKSAVGDALRFTNKDILHGSLLGIDKDNGVRWQNPEAKEPIVFKTATISEIRLDTRKPPENAQQQTHAVALTNNDELPGSILALDDQTLVLDTWYAGKLSIPRGMIKRITPLKATGSAIFEGPTSLEGWSVSKQGGGKSWSYRDGALVGTNYGMIGRDVKLPPVANIEFDVSWRGNPQLSVCFYSDRTDSISNCYMLQINSGYSYLQRYSRNGGSNNLGEVQLQNIMRKDKTRISLRTNKESKSVWLLVDGKLMKQWTDTGDWAGQGTSLVFNCQPGALVKVSNIKVTNWDGKFDEQRGADAKAPEDTVKLENKDKVSGKLKTIADGKAQFASAFAELTIPLDRVEEIVMSTEGVDQAKRNTGDVRAYFASRGSVTVQLEKWDDKEAVASSPNFGKAAFSPIAFQRIQFNLDQQPASASDDLATGGDGEETAE